MFLKMLIFVIIWGIIFEFLAKLFIIVFSIKMTAKLFFRQSHVPTIELIRFEDVPTPLVLLPVSPCGSVKLIQFRF